MTFTQIHKEYDWNEVKNFIHSRTAADVAAVMNKDTLTETDFAVLLSPAAEAFLEPWHGRQAA
ncbi:MAG: hypothetical protein LRY51_13175 [Geovibrio sp.]|nr:hypothetical protein [Geovibrio sp.]